MEAGRIGEGQEKNFLRKRKRREGRGASRWSAIRSGGRPAKDFRLTRAALSWKQVESLTEKIQKLDTTLEQIARTQYPETELLQQVHGVGTLIALTFVLTVEDRRRFDRSREVGCYVGLRPKQGESGESQPQLRISKEGDLYLRQLLVQGAHCILWRGPDTDLKRWGLKLAARGGKNAKKRAVVAVARKLAVLLHRLWVTGEVYEPLRNSQAQQEKGRAA